MSAANRVLYLRIALVVIGLSFIFGFYPLSIIWPSGCADGGNGSGSSMLLRGDLFRTTLQIGEALTVLRKLLQ